MGKFWGFSLLSLLAIPAAVFAQSNNTYDYVIVGSGPGGGTLAVKLAEAGASVLLLEAGDDQTENLHQKVGAWSSLADNDPLMRWDFFVKLHSDDKINDKYEHLTWRTTEGKFYVGLNPPTGAKKLGVYYPRAGTLGGCATHNAMCAVLPADSDWQNIVDFSGDKSWSPARMRQHFIDLEIAHSIPKGTPGHGWNGFLDITLNGNENIKNQSGLLEVLTAAAKTSGQDPAKIWDLMQTDHNNAKPDRDQQVGVIGFPGHRDPQGNRVTAGKAVLATLNAKNPDGSKKYKLTVKFDSLATKVLFDTSKSTSADAEAAKPRATGVEYLYGKSMYAADPRYNASVQGTKLQAYARKEVIISGGAFNSPQILKLSGIGPKAELTKFNITVLVDLPGVGANLQDNAEMGLVAHASSNFTSIAPPCTFGAPGDPCLELWKQGLGPYTQGPIDSIMFKSSKAKERDIFFFVLPGGSFQGYWPSDTVNQVPVDPPSTIDFSMVHFNPTSSAKLGTVNLVSANPRDTPDINFRFFEDAGAADDILALQEGIEFGRKVLASMNSTLAPFKEVLPCNGDAKCDIKDIIKTQAWSHHATSSCMIGPDTDPLAVLDSKFRVRGTLGLRVVDASAFPKPPGAFPVLPSFMLGMKAASDILDEEDDW